MNSNYTKVNVSSINFFLVEGSPFHTTACNILFLAPLFLKYILYIIYIYIYIYIYILADVYIILYFWRILLYIYYNLKCMSFFNKTIN